LKLLTAQEHSTGAYINICQRRFRRAWQLLAKNWRTDRNLAQSSMRGVDSKRTNICEIGTRTIARSAARVSQRVFPLARCLVALDASTHQRASYRHWANIGPITEAIIRQVIDFVASVIVTPTVCISAAPLERVLRGATEQAAAYACAISRGCQALAKPGMRAIPWILTLRRPGTHRRGAPLRDSRQYSTSSSYTAPWFSEIRVFQNPVGSRLEKSIGVKIPAAPFPQNPVGRP
jgi:hypothetical protein